MLPLALLVFCCTSLLALVLGSGLLRRRSRSVERLMMSQAASDVDPRLARDETLSIFRDRALSGIGLLQRLLTRFRFGATIQRLLEQADIKKRTGAVVLGMAVCASTGFLLVYTLRLGLLVAIAAAIPMGWLPILCVMHLRTRRIRRFETQFPEAVDLLSRAIQAGHSFNTGIEMIADEMPDPVGKEFQRVSEEQRYGLPSKTALLNLLDRVDLLDLRLFVVAVLIQRQSGGNLAELLARIAQTVRERFRIYRQLKIHTAQAKLTGIILICLPPLMGTVIALVNYRYMKIILEEPWGVRMLLGAALLQLLGLVWIRKVIDIKV